MPSDGVVYLVEFVDIKLFKVGASVTPRWRLLELARMGLGPVRFVGMIRSNDYLRLENYFRRLWKPWVTHGFEWFKMPPEEVAKFGTVSVVNYPGTPPVPSWKREEPDGQMSSSRKGNNPRRYRIIPGEVITEIDRPAKTPRRGKK